ncbi:MAG: hypothetical protein GJ677_07410 [Rhodobacteraceae bacterium]|nr:hypothetical protein [Paracoccaceae bacterium]
MRFRQSAAAMIAVFGMAHPVWSEAPPEDANDVVRGLSKSIYTAGELTGGDQEEWTVLELESVRALEAVAASDKSAFLKTDKHGRTPLINAAANGLYPLVRAILDSPQTQQDLNATDDDGLTAYHHALLSLNIHLQVCAPDANNPFALVPFYVSMPYYLDRNPYPKVLKALQDAGADTSQDAAKSYWLENCPNQSPRQREMVSETTDLFATLSTIQLELETAAKRQKVEEGIEILELVMRPSIEAGKATQDELDSAIETLYREAGLTPPSTLQDNK